ncbi:MAG: hypothetical protein HY922_08245, partial [Elusimicrobia bacterium]|nr:hypothetical protein [Elusimicrobiota bacterium]
MTTILKKSLVLLAILGVVLGAAYAVRKFRGGKEKAKPLSEIPTNLEKLPDSFFVKCGLDKLKYAKEAFTKSELPPAPVKRGKIILTDDPSGGFKVNGPAPCKLASAAALSSDDKYLAAVCKDEEGGGFILWETARGQRVGVLCPDLPPSQPFGFSPDGRTLGAIDKKGALVLWDAGSGKEIRTISEDKSSIVSFAFPPKRKALASGSKDGVLKLWDISSGSMEGWFKVSDKPVNYLGFHPLNPSLLFAGESPEKSESFLWLQNGLVFSTGTPQNPPFPRAYVHLASTEPTTASDPVSLDIVVDNSKGQGDLFQLAAITDSQAEPLLSKRLVFFGAVGAGTVSTKTAVFE